MTERFEGVSIGFAEHPDRSSGQIIYGPRDLIQGVVAMERAGSAWKPSNEWGFRLIKLEDGRSALHIKPRAIGKLPNRAQRTAINGVNRLVRQISAGALMNGLPRDPRLVLRRYFQNGYNFNMEAEVDKPNIPDSDLAGIVEARMRQTADDLGMATVALPSGRLNGIIDVEIDSQDGLIALSIGQDVVATSKHEPIYSGMVRLAGGNLSVGPSSLVLLAGIGQIACAEEALPTGILPVTM